MNANTGEIAVLLCHPDSVVEQVEHYSEQIGRVD